MSWYPWQHPSLTRNFLDPQFHNRQSALFLPPKAPLRPLKILVDPRLGQSSRNDPKANYLMELLAEDLVEAHFFDPDGPPSSARQIFFIEEGIEGFENWAVTQEEGDDRVAVVFEEGGVLRRRIIPWNEPLLTHLAFRDETKVHSDDAKLAPQELREARTLLVAKAMNVDLLITSSEMSFAPKDPKWWTTTVLTPLEAIPLIGLYLRAQDVYALGRSPAFGETSKPLIRNFRDRTWFYWEAAEAMLPSLHSFYTICESSSSEHGHLLRQLPQSLTWRLDQILRARDRILANLAVVPMKHDEVDDIVTDIDLILFFLVAAFDITARAAHLILDIPTEIRFAGWQNKRWRKEVRSAHTELGSLFNKPSQSYWLLKLLSLLRNTVHGNAFSAGGRVPFLGARPLEPVIRVPPDIAKDVMSAFGALEGTSSWGVEPTVACDEEILIHAGDFMERVLAPSLSVLEETLKAIGYVDRAILVEPRPRTLTEKRTLWQIGLPILGSFDRE